MTEPNQPELTTKDRARLKRLLAVIEMLLSTRSMTLTQATTLLQAMINEGSSLTTLAERCDVSKTVTSRHIQDLGQRNRRKEPEGPDLLRSTRFANDDRRIRRVLLTERGADLGRKIIAIMKGKPDRTASAQIIDVFPQKPKLP